MKKLAILAALAAFSGAYAQQSFTFAGPVASIDVANDADNVTLASNSASSFALGNFLLSSAILTENATNSTGDFARENRIRVRNSDFTATADFFDIQPFTTAGYTTLTLAAPQPYSTGALFGRTISATSTWSFQFYNTIDDGTAGAAEAFWTDLSFTAQASPPPPSADDTELGGSLTTTLTAGEVKFYEFDYTGGAFTIDTFGSLLTSSNDTELALFNSGGLLVGLNDDADTTTLLSSLSFADGALAAGTYYLAASAFSTTFENGFLATSTSPNVGSLVINGIKPAAPVPEPATMAALGFGALALLRRRRT